MSAIISIIVKGNSPSEINKNFGIIDSAMEPYKDLMIRISDLKYNPRVYYNKQIIETSKIHNIITSLKNDKQVRAAIKQIEYSSSLNKM